MASEIRPVIQHQPTPLSSRAAQTREKIEVREEVHQAENENRQAERNLQEARREEQRAESKLRAARAEKRQALRNLQEARAKQQQTGGTAEPSPQNGEIVNIRV
ncbi:MAG: hypothetical protein R6V20_05900 [Desulfobia sp.]